MEIKVVLQPKQKLFAKSIDENRVTFYGGARGGGKSAGLRLIINFINFFLLFIFK